MTLPKNVKSRFLDFEKCKKTYSRTTVYGWWCDRLKFLPQNCKNGSILTMLCMVSVCNSVYKLEFDIDWRETVCEISQRVRKPRTNNRLGWYVGLNWIEQCFTSLPTQYRLYGRRFLQVKRPSKQYQSTEGESYKGKQPREHKENTNYTYAYTHKTVDK